MGSSASTKAIAIGKDPTFQVTSASAVAGGVFGGVVGSTVGTVTGAAIGLIPAVFTFGLSIPVGATMGLCTGAFAGSTTGLWVCGTRCTRLLHQQRPKQQILRAN